MLPLRHGLADRDSILELVPPLGRVVRTPDREGGSREELIPWMCFIELMFL